MSDAADLRSFVERALVDLGATVSEGGPFLWVQMPDALRASFEVPATVALTFDPERTGEFDAELVAPGGYFMEKLLGQITGRGRWDLIRYVPPADWVPSNLSSAGLGAESGVRFEVLGAEDGAVVLLSFRVTLVSDEKREALYGIAVSSSTGSACAFDLEAPDPEGATPLDGAISLDLENLYRIGTRFLSERSREAVDGFRAASLRLLEEEVRRIFSYFDRTVEEVRQADPAGSDDLIRAIQEERDRRLTETLERFDPKAAASLCSIRAIVTPMVRLRLEFPDGTSAEAVVDAWSRRVAGLVCSICHGTDGPWRPQRDRGLRCARCA